ncbi:MAG: hypothetical protein ACRDL4_11635 [Thermoleophilaceae bacterium]
MPWALDAAVEQRILSARRRTNYGPARLSGLVGRHRSTVWKVLRRPGCSRRRRSEPRQSLRRYEWAQPGALLHIDAMQLAKFDRPGHWATGRGYRRSRGAGRVYVVSVLDDHSRLADSELHSCETAATVTATLRRAEHWMREQGCGPVEAVMSDNQRPTPATPSGASGRARRPPHSYPGLYPSSAADRGVGHRGAVRT